MGGPIKASPVDYSIISNQGEAFFLIGKTRNIADCQADG